jgi:hypothetical protein
MSHKHTTQLEKLMSKWLDDTLALVATIVKGTGTDQATKDAVTALQTQLASDEADAAEQKQVINAIINQLAVAPPATPVAPVPAA